MNLEDKQSQKPPQPKGLPPYKITQHPAKKQFRPEGLPKYMYADEREEILRARQEKIDKEIEKNKEARKKDKSPVDVPTRLKIVDNNLMGSGIPRQARRYEQLKSPYKEIAKEVLTGKIRRWDKEGLPISVFDIKEIMDLIESGKLDFTIAAQSEVEQRSAEDKYYIPEEERKEFNRQVERETELQKAENKELIKLKQKINVAYRKLVKKSKRGNRSYF